MPLNPFFLQGSQSEQRLIQELINEQLTIYGVEVIYIPRKIVNQDNILNEIESSKFDDNFAIEAYVNTFDGYGGAGDIMTKFGMSLKDELTVTISKERFEDFIAPFLSGANDANDSEINVITRPREGDLIYFPLGKRIFEVKFVEHEQPFYQLGKNYVYQLKCELFEYQDELGGWNQLSTTTEEIDSVIETQGYITSLVLVGSGVTALAEATINTGYIRELTLIDDGYDYTSIPTVSISAAPAGGTNATAVATIRNKNNGYSVDQIYLTNPGAGYIEAPTITISGGGGTGAVATCSIETVSKGISTLNLVGVGVDDSGNPTFVGGDGYPTAPTVSASTPVGPGATATATVNVGTGTVTALTVTNGGKYYGTAPSVIIDAPALPSYASTDFVSSGTYAAKLENSTNFDTREGTDNVGTVKFDWYYDGGQTPGSSVYLYSSDKFKVKWQDTNKRVLVQVENLSNNTLDDRFTIDLDELDNGAGWYTFEFSFNGIFFAWWSTQIGGSNGRVLEHSENLATYGDGSFYQNQTFLLNGQFSLAGTGTTQYIDNLEFYDDASVYNGAQASNRIFLEDFEIGVTAQATSSITSGVVTSFTITNPGTKYISAPNVSIGNSVSDKEYSLSGMTRAIIIANVSAANTVTSLYISNPGEGYEVAPTITISNPASAGIGTFQYNEVVVGSISGATSRVKTWDASTNILKLGTTNGTFVAGDIITGATSGAKFTVDYIKSAESSDKYDKGEEFETEADSILNFTETNPFGTY